MRHLRCRSVRSLLRQYIVQKNIMDRNIGALIPVIELDEQVVRSGRRKGDAGHDRLPDLTKLLIDGVGASTHFQYSFNCDAVLFGG